MTTAFPAVSATVAALIGLLAVFLTFRVIALRVRFKVNAGDGGHAALAQAIRAHANLLELAPLALLLLAFAEWSIAWRGVIVGARRPPPRRPAGQRLGPQPFARAGQREEGRRRPDRAGDRRLFRARPLSHAHHALSGAGASFAADSPMPC